ncbi:MAG: DinB family protein [Candidatus Acidiferrales bacterium]
MAKKSQSKPKSKRKTDTTSRKTTGNGNDKALREMLRKVLSWGEAHADWKQALAGLDAAQRGLRPPGSPHSAWELLEHARLAQRDILEFTRNAQYKSPEWPAGYWPKNLAPANDAEWEKSVQAFFQDTQAMGKLVMDPQADLSAPIPHGTGQTLLRQALLLADHNSYHLGQFVLVRRLVGAWREG